MTQQTLNVLLELGRLAGAPARRSRAGAEVLDAIEQWPNALSLAGIEVYEGCSPRRGDPRLLRRAVETLKRLTEEEFASNG